jgi:putative hydrolase of the HAD superfamily
MSVRAVVLDIGGVLETTPETGWSARWETELGLGPGEFWERTLPAWTGADVGTTTLEEVHRGLGRALSLHPRRVDVLMEDFWAEYLGTLNAELADWFAGLRPRWRTGILSNSAVGARERERERYGFEAMTDLIVYSHEVGMTKPDPRVYRLTCDRLGVRPEETVFVDDAEAAVAGARAAGLHAVRFVETSQAIADVEALLAS